MAGQVAAIHPEHAAHAKRHHHHPHGDKGEDGSEERQDESGHGVPLFQFFTPTKSGALGQNTLPFEPAVGCL